MPLESMYDDYCIDCLELVEDCNCQFLDEPSKLGFRILQDFGDYVEIEDYISEEEDD